MSKGYYVADEGRPDRFEGGSYDEIRIRFRQSEVPFGMSTETQPAPVEPLNPYHLIGGAAAVRRITDRFYDIMNDSPEARAVRAMHSGDLAPMRQKLFEFMSGWLGGPNLYFERSDRKCMGSAHAPFNIGETERNQWLACMYRSLEAEGIDRELRKRIETALFQVADMMCAPRRS